MEKIAGPIAGIRKIGLIGLGRMGEAMASRLLGAGHDLAVWNRSRRATELAKARGAQVAVDARALFASCEAVLLVLANAEAADNVLGRAGTKLSVDVGGCLVIQLGTTLPAHSKELAEAITANGGRYVEAPVSGSRQPAEEGRLVAMLGGASERDLIEAEAILECLTSRRVRVGEPPMAMRMKLAVNSFLVPLVLALGEAFEIATALGLDLQVFAEILNESPMASDVSRGKMAKLLVEDWAAQASISDVLMNANLISIAARNAGATAELVAVCQDMLERAQVSGHGALDMVAASRVARQAGA